MRDFEDFLLIIDKGNSEQLILMHCSGTEFGKLGYETAVLR